MKGIRWPALRHLLVLAVVAYSVLHVAYSLWRYNIFVEGRQSLDLWRVFDETAKWRAAGTGPLPLHAVLYPPLYYLLLWPLTSWEFRHVVYLFYFPQFIFFPIAVVCLVKAISPLERPRPMEYLFAGVLTANFQPLLETLALHKVEGLETLLICLALYALKKNRRALTGVLVFLAANLKYLPGILGVYFVLKRDWRVVKGVLVSLLVYLVVLIPVFGASGIATYVFRYPMTMLFEHEHEGTRPEASMEFQTLTGTINRWFVGPEKMAEHVRTQGYIVVPHADVALRMATVLKVVLLALYLYVIFRARRRDGRTTQWVSSLYEISLTLLMIFMIAQATRVHYAILLLPAFVIVGLVFYHHGRLFPWTARLFFWVAYGLTAMVVPGGLLNTLPPHPLWGQHHSFAYLWMSFPFYGYVLLGLSILLCYRTLQRSPGLLDSREPGG